MYRAGPGVGREREHARVVRGACLLEVLFGFAYDCHLGESVNHAGNRVVVHCQEGGPRRSRRSRSASRSGRSGEAAAARSMRRCIDKDNTASYKKLIGIMG